MNQWYNIYAFLPRKSKEKIKGILEIADVLTETVDLDPETGKYKIDKIDDRMINADNKRFVDKLTSRIGAMLQSPNTNNRGEIEELHKKLAVLDEYIGKSMQETEMPATNEKKGEIR